MPGMHGDIRPLEYPMFKGLQRPLEFMGIQGRYIYWAAGAIGLGSGAALILLKQRKGLHSKKNDKGVFVYARSKGL